MATITEDQAIKDLCRLVKQCMDSAHKLSRGGRDVPQLVRRFETDIANLVAELSSGEAASVIDTELAKVNEPSLGEILGISQEELKKLIAREFVVSGRYNLGEFVSTKSILRAVLVAREESEAEESESAILSANPSDALADLVGRNAHIYQSELFSVRQKPVDRDADSRSPKKAGKSDRIIKKKVKKNIGGGIYNTLCGVMFIASNTLTNAMSDSAKIANAHFKAAEIQLFAKSS